MRFLLIFILASGSIFALFYFYPANIFNATLSGEFASVTADVSLQAILFKENLPSQLIASNIQSITPTFQGYMILMVCLVGLPLMIAFRYAKPSPRKD